RSGARRDRVAGTGPRGGAAGAKGPRPAAGRPGRALLPRLPAVGAAVARRARAAVDDRPDVPPPLEARRDEHIRVPRVEHDIGHAGVVVDVQDLVPGLPAVGRLVKAAVAARPPA